MLFKITRDAGAQIAAKWWSSRRVQRGQPPARGARQPPLGRAPNGRREQRRSRAERSPLAARERRGARAARRAAARPASTPPHPSHSRSRSRSRPFLQTNVVTCLREARWEQKRRPRGEARRRRGGGAGGAGERVPSRACGHQCAQERDAGNAGERRRQSGRIQAARTKGPARSSPNRAGGSEKAMGTGPWVEFEAAPRQAKWAETELRKLQIFVVMIHFMIYWRERYFQVLYPRLI